MARLGALEATNIGLVYGSAIISEETQVWLHVGRPEADRDVVMHDDC